MKPAPLPSTGNKAFFFLSIIVLFTHKLPAQQVLPLIRATSTKVSVRDGNVYRESAWNLSQHIDPDIYYVLEPLRKKTITFYTDIDSISFKINPGESKNFIILLNEKDSFNTRISATIQPHGSPPGSVEIVAFAKKLLQEDLLFFRNTLQKNHPGLYRYKTADQVNEMFDSCYNTLKDSMTNLEFGKIIMYIISGLEDGHTGSTVPRLLTSHYGQNKPLFPIYLYFIGNRAYALCSAVENIYPGTEILSIDGEPVSEILNNMFKYLPSDGKIESKKRMVVSEGNFGMLYSWLYGQKLSFAVTYRKDTLKSAMATLAATIVSDGMPCKWDQAPPARKLLNLSLTQDTIACITIQSFDENRLSKESFRFKAFLDTTFKKISESNCSRLIIDLRGNGGGLDEYGAMLYSYLTDKPFHYFSSKYSTTDTVNEKDNPLLGVSLPADNNYKGKLFILTDGRTFSTAADFSARVRSDGRGTFIGEETGGGYHGNTSGGVLNVILPHTQFTVFIPLYHYTNDVKPAKFHDRGVIPDVQVLPSIQDVLQHRDRTLLVALQLTRSQNK